MKAFAWIEPEDLRAAVAAGAQPGALFKAGGVDVQDRLKEHIDEPRQLVNLRRLKELDFLREENGLRPLLGVRQREGIGSHSGELRGRV